MQSAGANSRNSTSVGFSSAARTCSSNLDKRGKNSTSGEAIGPFNSAPGLSRRSAASVFLPATASSASPATAAAVPADWRAFQGTCDLALAADVLYEQRYVGALLELLPHLAPEVLLADGNRQAFG